MQSVPRQPDDAMTSALASAALYCPPEAAPGNAFALWIVHGLGALWGSKRPGRQGAHAQGRELPTVASQVPIV